MSDSTRYTYRMKYTDEYDHLKLAYAKARQAYSDLIDGKITSYSLGNRSITRTQADLKTMHEIMNEMLNRMSELEAILNGRPIRKTTRCVFVDPALSPWTWR